MLPLATHASAASPAAATTSSSAGSVGIRLLDVPGNEVNDPRARLYIVDHLAPGAVIHRRIEVSNSTPSAVRVELYAAAAAIDSGSFIGDAAHTANDVSTWTSVIPSTPDIASGANVVATVTIAVPANAVSGEQYAVVWAEVGTAATTVAGVAEVNRVGIRIYLSVGTGTTPTADFTIESLTAARSPQGHPVVIAVVDNVGGRALDMSGALQLSAGPGGLSAGPFPAALGVTLAIGQTERVTITLDDVIPDGPWDALVTLHSGLTERSARATITFPSSGAAKPVKALQRRRTSNGAGLAAAIVLALLAIGGVGVLLLRRRGRAQPPALTTSSRRPPHARV